MMLTQNRIRVNLSHEFIGLHSIKNKHMYKARMKQDFPLVQFHVIPVQRPRNSKMARV